MNYFDSTTLLPGPTGIVVETSIWHTSIYWRIVEEWDECTEWLNKKQKSL